MKLAKIFKTLIIESIDIFSLDYFRKNGVQITIFEESHRRCRIGFIVNNKYYIVYISPIFSTKIPNISFGNTNQEYENLNLNKLQNSPNVNHILSIIFSIIRYWIDKFNIQTFEYGTTPGIRAKLYNYYLEKHFNDFILASKDPLPNNNFNYIWKKK